MRTISRVMCTAGALVALGGCSDFLEAPDALANPNQPTSADINQLFVGAQTALTLQYTSDLARTVCIWMQQCAGTERQYGLLGVYSYGEDSYDASFSQVYTGGGLIDIREVQRRAATAGDDIYGGIARVIEVMQVGLAADVWGDIPYSKALVEQTPALDPQQQVYATLQAKLDTAITMLASGRGTGPGGSDLYYGGDAAKWGRLAHTLKARYALRLAERQGTSAYQLALREAQLGLRPGDDFLGIAGANPQSNNAWYQFTVIQRAGYMFAGRFLVDLMKARNDQRLDRYFLPNTAGAFMGAAPGDQTSSQWSGFAVEVDPAYRQPIVTWQENNLIIAEAAFRLGDVATARTALNQVQAAAGNTPATTVTLNEILTEKYITLFQNVEVWNDYKRTCFPALTPAPGATAIPGRLLYSVGERNSNPNIPAPDAQPPRNWNDVAGCTSGGTTG